MAVKAIDTMHQKEVNGRKLYVARAQTRSERDSILKKQREDLRKRTKLCNLYVKPLPSTLTEQKLREYFASCGTITSAKIMHNADGSSKGFGFVCFSQPEEATRARDEDIKIDGKQLYVNLAQSKEERSQYLEAQHRPRGVPMANVRGFGPTWAAAMPQGYPYPHHGHFMPGVNPNVKPVPMPKGVEEIQMLTRLNQAVLHHLPELKSHSNDIAKQIFASTKGNIHECELLLNDPLALKEKAKEFQRR